MISNASNAPRTLKELVDKITAEFTEAWLGPEIRDGRIPVREEVEIPDALRFRLTNGVAHVLGAVVTGTVEWVKNVIPVEDSCFLEDEHGRPFAGTALTSLRSGLAGLAVSAHSQELRLFHIPEAIRNVRPVREKIFDSLPVANDAELIFEPHRPEPKGGRSRGDG